MTLAILLLALFAFAALVLALVTGNVGWAFACIAIAVVGCIVLIVDIAKRRKHKK